MTIDLRKAVTVLAKFASLFFLLRALAAFAPWLYVNPLAAEDPVIRYLRNTAAVSALVNFVFFAFFLAGRSSIGRWIAPEGRHEVEEPSELVLAGVRLIASICLVVGLVSAISSTLGWYLQTTSAYVSEVWYPQSEVRSGLIRGGVATAVGVAVIVGSRRVAHYLSR